MDRQNGGKQPEIARHVAEATRKCGLKIAEDVKAAAKQARESCTAIEKEAEELAQAAIEATSKLANQIDAYLTNCATISASFREHKESLMHLPEPTNLPEKPELTAGLDAVEKELAPLLPPQQPTEPMLPRPKRA
jgi:hypothetical protein